MRPVIAPFVVSLACAAHASVGLAQEPLEPGEAFFDAPPDAPAPQVPSASLAPSAPSAPAGAPAFASSPSTGSPVADGGDRAVDASLGAPRDVRARKILHGFRMGYLYLMNADRPTQTPDDLDCPDCSLEEKYDLRTPHQFLIGYELMARMVGKDWLNVILVGNVIASGLEQSRFFPSANALVGFELDQSFQVGVGGNFTLEERKAAHMIVAAGWTPEVGGFYVPVHAFFIPDVDKNHRMGMTVGVNW